MNIKKHDFFILLTNLPLILFFAFSNYALMELYFKITFTVFFLYYLFFKGTSLTLSFVLVSLPFHAMLKGGYFFYNIIPIIMFILLMKILASNFNIAIFKNKNFKFFFFGSVLYYLMSLIISGGLYETNLKALEFAFSLFIIPALYQNKYLFKRSLFYFGLFSISLALIFSSTWSRTQLSFEYIDVASISGLNPIIFGISLLVFIILYFNENFILKTNKGFINIEKCFFILSIIAVFLTTSRTSILAMLTCFLFYFFKNNILSIIKPIIILAIMFIIFHDYLYILSSVYSDSYDFIVGRSLNEDIDFNQYSHDRADMYSLIFNEIQKGNYIINGILPGGDSTQIYNDLSKKKHMIHSLTLKLIIEIGLFFTSIFMFWIFSFIKKTLKRDNFHQYAGLIGWVTITLFTTGLDVLSALVLSISFIQINNIYEKETINNSILSSP